MKGWAVCPMKFCTCYWCTMLSSDMLLLFNVPASRRLSREHPFGICLMLVCPKPIHLPIALAAMVVLLVARPSEGKLSGITGEGRETFTLRRDTGHRHGPSASGVSHHDAMPQDTPTSERAGFGIKLLEFTKRLYEETDTVHAHSHNSSAGASLIPRDIQEQFARLSSRLTVQPPFSGEQAVLAVLELRLLELQRSVRHARQMVDMVTALSKTEKENEGNNSA